MKSLLTANDYNHTDQADIISASIGRSFGRLLSQPKTLPTLFNELTNRLTKFFSISRATLILMEPVTGRMRLISMWDDFLLREGLILDLPERKSLIYQMAKSGLTSYVADPLYFPGNRIEKRMMYNDKCRSLIICSATPNHSSIPTEGFITLASPIPDAFEMIRSGHFDSILAALGEMLFQKRGERRLGLTGEKRLAI